MSRGSSSTGCGRRRTRCIGRSRGRWCSSTSPASPCSPSTWRGAARSGPSLLRDTLDVLFRALLDEAYEWGAGLWSGAVTRCSSCSTATGTRTGLPSGLGDAAHARPGRAARARVADPSRSARRSGSRPVRSDFFTAAVCTASSCLTGPVATETVTVEAGADAGRDRDQPARSRGASTPRCVRSAKTAGPRCSRLRRTQSGGGRRASGACAASDVATCIPIAARDPRAARAQRAGAPHDHGGVHRPDGHRRAARPLWVRTGSRRLSTSA